MLISSTGPLCMFNHIFAWCLNFSIAKICALVHRQVYFFRSFARFGIRLWSNSLILWDSVSFFFLLINVLRIKNQEEKGSRLFHASCNTGGHLHGILRCKIYHAQILPGMLSSNLQFISLDLLDWQAKDDFVMSASEEGQPGSTFLTS